MKREITLNPPPTHLPKELKVLTTDGPEVPHQEQSPLELLMFHRVKQSSPLLAGNMKLVKASPTPYKAAALSDGKFPVPPTLACLQKGQ